MENLNSLKCDFITIEEHFRDAKLIYRKEKAFFNFIRKIFPYGIEGTYSFSDIGTTCIRCFINLEGNEEATVNVIKWIKTLRKKRLTIEKFWRPEQGYFSYRIQRSYPDYNDYLILIEQTANIDGCVIKKKRKMQTIFETDCEKISTILIHD